MTLSELSTAAGLPARTVRFYIARGLVPGPRAAGRGASYDAEHLARLREIRKMQARGLMLAEIARELGGERKLPLPAPTAWWNYPVSGDVTVLVRSDAGPWRLKQVRKALAEFSACLQQEAEEEEA